MNYDNINNIMLTVKQPTALVLPKDSGPRPERLAEDELFGLLPTETKRSVLGKWFAEGMNLRQINALLHSKPAVEIDTQYEPTDAVINALHDKPKLMAQLLLDSFETRDGRPVDNFAGIPKIVFDNFLRPILIHLLGYQEVLKIALSITNNSWYVDDKNLKTIELIIQTLGDNLSFEGLDKELKQIQSSSVLVLLAKTGKLPTKVIDDYLLNLKVDVCRGDKDYVRLAPYASASTINHLILELNDSWHSGAIDAFIKTGKVAKEKQEQAFASAMKRGHQYLAQAAKGSPLTAEEVTAVQERRRAIDDFHSD